MNILLKFREDWLQDYKDKDQSLVPAWIYFEHNGEFYPDDDWIDNPATLLGWWLHSITELLQGREGQGLSFMEGPFFIKITLNNSELLLECEEGHISWKVDSFELSKELIRAANEASRKFYEAGMLKISENLNEGIKSLKKALSEL